MSPSTIRLDRKSNELARALEHGRFSIDGRTFSAVPVSVDSSSVELALRDVSAAEVDANTPAMSRAQTWFRAIRAISLTATLTPALAVVLYGVVRGWQARPLLAITAITGAALLQVGVNLMNDAEDHVRLIDLPGTLGGAGLIQRGLLTARSVRRAAYVALAAGVIAGLPALLAEPRLLAGIGVVALLGAFGYSARPLGLKYIALGDLTVALLCGPALTLGAAVATFGRFDAPTVWLGVFFGAAATGILHTNNMQDVDVDHDRGATTVASLIGARASRAYLVSVYVLALGAFALFVQSAALPRALYAGPALGALILAPWLLRYVRAASPNSAGFELVRVEAAQRHLILGILCILSLGVAYVAR